MRSATCATILLTAAAIVIDACGGSNPQAVTTKVDSPRTHTQSSSAKLEKAAREAINKDHALLISALWTNRIPANPPATAGPALTLLRGSVAERQKQGVRVRVLSDNFRVLSLQLEPTYTTATATVLDRPRVQPTHLDGRPLGGPSSTFQRVRVELRRIGNTTSFVVWRTTLIK